MVPTGEIEYSNIELLSNKHTLWSAASPLNLIFFSFKKRFWSAFPFLVFFYPFILRLTGRNGDRNGDRNGGRNDNTNGEEKKIFSTKRRCHCCKKKGGGEATAAAAVWNNKPTSTLSSFFCVPGPTLLIDVNFGKKIRYLRMIDPSLSFGTGKRFLFGSVSTLKKKGIGSARVGLQSRKIKWNPVEAIHIQPPSTPYNRQ